MARKDKTPKAGKLAGLRAVKAVPAKAARPLEADDGCLILRFNQVDLGGLWSVTNASPTHLVQIMAAVKQFETMKPLEAFRGQPGKDYKTAELPSKDARDRLIELEHDDEDIACLRLSGPGRLWGFRRGRYFHVLWWDPKHEVWPSKFGTPDRSAGQQHPAVNPGRLTRQLGGPSETAPGHLPRGRCSFVPPVWSGCLCGVALSASGLSLPAAARG